MNVLYIGKKRARPGSNIVGKNAPKKWQGMDDIFLHRSQVNLGVEFVYYGRLDHGAIWRVSEIKTYSPGGRTTKVDTVQTMHDNVVLVRRGSNETRQIGFTYLSYSAVWRLHK